MRTIAHIGKESNQLEDIEVGLVEDLEEVQSEYGDYYSRVFIPLVVPVLRMLGVRATARRTGFAVGAVSAALGGKARPRVRNMPKYESIAVDYANEVLAQAGLSASGRGVDSLAQVRAIGWASSEKT